MMQTAEPWHGNDPAACIGISSAASRPAWGLLRQAKMRSVLVVVTDVLIHQAFQMPFIENDHMVEQIAAAVADPTLGNAVLPRTSEAGSLWLDAEALYGVDDFFIEVAPRSKIR